MRKLGVGKGEERCEDGWVGMRIRLENVFGFGRVEAGEKGV